MTRRPRNALADVAYDAAIAHDPDGVIVHWNPAAEGLFGYTADEAEGSTLDLLLPDERRGELAALVDQLSSGQPLEPFETVWHRKDGRAVPVTVSGSPAEESTDHSWLVARRRTPFFPDAPTPARAVDQAFDHTGVGLAVTDLDGRIVDVNDAYLEMLGLDLDQIREKSFLEVTHPADRKRSREGVRSLLDGERSSLVMLKRYLSRDGTVFWGRVSVFVARAPSGEPLHLVALIDDITGAGYTHQTARGTKRDYAALVHSIDGIVWEAEADPLTFTFVSERAEEILGYPVERWLADPDFWADHIHPEDREWVLNTCATASSRLEDHDFEYRMVAADGETVWLDDRVRVFKDPDGTTRLLGVMVDITEERQAMEQASLLASIVRASEAAVMAVSTDGIIESWNRGAEKLYGYTEEEAVGRPVRDLIPPDRREEARRVLERIREGETVESLETERRTRAGDHIWVSITVSPVFDDRGRVTRMVSVSRDITQRKAAEKGLRESEAEYRSLFEAAPLGIFRSIPDGRIVRANPELVRILGYDSVDEVLALDLPTQVYSDRSEREEIGRATGQADYYTNEATWTRKGGDAIQVRMKTRVVRDPEGQVKSFETFVEDITEHRNLEARLRQAQRVESLGRLAGGVAHDFNNILTAVLGSAELLLGELDSETPGHQEAEEIKRAAERAADLTRQLLAFSRRQVLQHRVVDLNEIVRDTKHMLRRLIGEDIELVTDLDEGLRPIQADKAQIEQVIVNLAVNAQDAMPEGGRIEIRTENVDGNVDGNDDPGSYVRLAVTDTGHGMDEETASKVFDPFFTTKETGKGTGLGMATVYGIVTQSDGQIRIDSEPGVGTTFEVYLPAAAEAPDPDEEAADPELAAQGETVLLVEDDVAVRSLAVTTLERQGYEVLEASDGKAALALVRDREEPLDLLITDMVLPGLDGIVVAQMLREAQPGLRLLFISGYAHDVTRDHPLVEGAAYLPKPFTGQELARKVRKVLAG